MHRVFLTAALLLALVQPAAARFYDLLNAARVNDTASARQLLAGGTEPNGGPSGFSDSYSPLQWAAWHGNLELVQLLIAAGADTERRDFNGDRPLLWAASAGQADAISVLLASGAPANSPDDPYGNAPLIKAAWPGHADAVRVLIAGGADVNAPAQGGDTALRYGVLSRNPEVVRLLLEAGADPAIADDILRETPLHIAATRGPAEIVRLLIVADAPLDPLDKDGRVPLFIAAQAGQVEAVRLLLAAGAGPVDPEAIVLSNLPSCDAVIIADDGQSAGLTFPPCLEPGEADELRARQTEAVGLLAGAG